MSNTECLNSAVKLRLKAERAEGKQMERCSSVPVQLHSETCCPVTSADSLVLRPHEAAVSVFLGLFFFFFLTGIKKINLNESLLSLSAVGSV